MRFAASNLLAALLLCAGVTLLSACQKGDRPRIGDHHAADAGIRDSHSGLAGPASPFWPPAAAVVTFESSVIIGPADIEHRALAITLDDGDGRTRGSGSALPPGNEQRATVWLADDEGGDVLPRPGEIIAFDFDTEASTVRSWRQVVPPLRLHFDRESGVVSGATAPDAALRMVLQRGATPDEPPVAPDQPDLGMWAADGSRIAGPVHTPEPKDLAEPGDLIATSQADSTGAFTFSLGAAAGLAGGLPVSVSALVSPTLVVATERLVPYVRVSLHPGDISGAARPLTPVTATLREADGSLTAVGHGPADVRGRFQLWLRDDGRRVRPVAGQTLEVDDGEYQHSLVVPHLTADHNSNGEGLNGSAEPGAAIAVTLWNPWMPGEVDGPRGAADADGRWSLSPSVAIVPASHYYVTARRHNGDETFYCYQVPLVAVYPGLQLVTVEGLWEATASLELLREGVPIATAEGGGPWSGVLNLTWRNAAGDPEASLPGDVVRGQVDDTPVSFEVPLLTTSLDQESGQLVGTTQPGAEVKLASFAPLGPTVNADSEGNFTLPLGERAGPSAVPRPGRILHALVELAGGHQARSAHHGPALTMYADGTVDGRAAPGALELTVDAPSSATVKTTLTASAASSFEGRLPGAEALWSSASAILDDPAFLAAPFEWREVAATVTLASASSTAVFHVPPLVWLDGEPPLLSGLGPPAELVELRVRPAAGMPEEIATVVVDDSGRWSHDLRRDPTLAHLAPWRRLSLVWQEDGLTVIHPAP